MRYEDLKVDVGRDCACKVFPCMMQAGEKRIQSRIMVCSYCKSDEPRPHNVRTCKYLQAAIAVFVGYKGTKMTMDIQLQGRLYLFRSRPCFHGRHGDICHRPVRGVHQVLRLD